MSLDAGPIEGELPSGTSSAYRTALVAVDYRSQPLQSTVGVDRCTMKIRQNANLDGQQWQDECASSTIIRQLPAETEAAVVFGYHSATALGPHWLYVRTLPSLSATQCALSTTQLVLNDTY